MTSNITELSNRDLSSSSLQSDTQSPSQLLLEKVRTIRALCERQRAEIPKLSCLSCHSEVPGTQEQIPSVSYITNERTQDEEQKRGVSYITNERTQGLSYITNERTQDEEQTQGISYITKEHTQDEEQKQGVSYITQEHTQDKEQMPSVSCSTKERTRGYSNTSVHAQDRQSGVNEPQDIHQSRNEHQVIQNNQSNLNKPTKSLQNSQTNLNDPQYIDSQLSYLGEPQNIQSGQYNSNERHNNQNRQSNLNEPKGTQYQSNQNPSQNPTRSSQSNQSTPGDYAQPSQTYGESKEDSRFSVTTRQQMDQKCLRDGKEYSDSDDVVLIRSQPLTSKESPPLQRKDSEIYSSRCKTQLKEKKLQHFDSKMQHPFYQPPESSNQTSPYSSDTGLATWPSHRSTSEDNFASPVLQSCSTTQIPPDNVKLSREEPSEHSATNFLPHKIQNIELCRQISSHSIPFAANSPRTPSVQEDVDVVRQGVSEWEMTTGKRTESEMSTGDRTESETSTGDRTESEMSTGDRTDFDVTEEVTSNEGDTDRSDYTSAHESSSWEPASLTATSDAYTSNCQDLETDAELTYRSEGQGSHDQIEKVIRNERDDPYYSDNYTEGQSDNNDMRETVRNYPYHSEHFAEGQSDNTDMRETKRNELEELYQLNKYAQSQGSHVEMNTISKRDYELYRSHRYAQDQDPKLDVKKVARNELDERPIKVARNKIDERPIKNVARNELDERPIKKVARNEHDERPIHSNFNRSDTEKYAQDYHVEMRDVDGEEYDSRPIHTNSSSADIQNDSRQSICAQSRKPDDPYRNSDQRAVHPNTYRSSLPKPDLSFIEEVSEESSSEAPKPKRTFLKKGQGTCRFNMKPMKLRKAEISATSKHPSPNSVAASNNKTASKPEPSKTASKVTSRMPMKQLQLQNLPPLSKPKLLEGKKSGPPAKGHTKPKKPSTVSPSTVPGHQVRKKTPTDSSTRLPQPTTDKLTTVPSTPDFDLPSQSHPSTDKFTVIPSRRLQQPSADKLTMVPSTPEFEKMRRKEQAELVAFEKLEELADDSSFSSTSSTVVRLLKGGHQQNSTSSTPLRISSPVPRFSPQSTPIHATTSNQYSANPGSTDRLNQMGSESNSNRGGSTGVVNQISRGIVDQIPRGIEMNSNNGVNSGIINQRPQRREKINLMPGDPQPIFNINDVLEQLKGIVRLEGHDTLDLSDDNVRTFLESFSEHPSLATPNAAEQFAASVREIQRSAHPTSTPTDSSMQQLQPQMSGPHHSQPQVFASHQSQGQSFTSHQSQGQSLTSHQSYPQTIASHQFQLQSFSSHQFHPQSSATQPSQTVALMDQPQQAPRVHFGNEEVEVQEFEVSDGDDTLTDATSMAEDDSDLIVTGSDLETLTNYLHLASAPEMQRQAGLSQPGRYEEDSEGETTPTPESPSPNQTPPKRKKRKNLQPVALQFSPPTPYPKDSASHYIWSVFGKERDSKKLSKPKKHSVKPKHQVTSERIPNEQPQKPRQEERKINTHIQAQDDDIEAHKTLLLAHIAKLEKETMIFQQENARLSKLQQEVQADKEKLAEERTKLQEETTREKEKLQEYIDRERNALWKEKKQEMAQSVPSISNVKENSLEILYLKEQLQDQREEVKKKESVHQFSLKRLNDRLKVLESENKQLKSKNTTLEKENLDLKCKLDRARASNRPKNSNPRKEQGRPNSKTKTVDGVNRSIDRLVRPQIKVVREPGQGLTGDILNKNGNVDSLTVNQLSGNVNERIAVENNKRISEPNTMLSREQSNTVTSSTNREQGQVINILTQPSNLNNNRTENINRPYDSVPVSLGGTKNEPTVPALDSLTVTGSSRLVPVSLGRGEDYKTVPVNLGGRVNHLAATTPEDTSLDFTETIKEDGTRELIYANGTKKTIHPDGTRIMSYYNGDTKEVRPDRTVYIYGTDHTSHTIYNNGSEVFVFPSGQTETRHPDGSSKILFADGTQRSTAPDGTETCTMKDGTVVCTKPDGNKVVEFPNGQIEVHSEREKRREYPDGTIKILYPDGRTETRYSNGRLRVKDAIGNLLVDTHVKDT